MEPKTCGNCKWSTEEYWKEEGICYCTYPMPRCVLSLVAKISVDEPADTCKCWEPQQGEGT